MNIIEQIQEHRKELERRFGVQRIGIFGSGVRNEMNEESDFDVLVSFQSGEITFDNYMDLKFYLEDLVCREVDLVTDDALKSRIQEQVLEQVEYAWKTDPAGVS